MAQKTSPIGLRVGLTRKWNYTWYNQNVKSFFFMSLIIEKFLKDSSYFYRYTKISKRKKILFLDLKFFKTFYRQIFFFYFFYKIKSDKKKVDKKKLFKKKFLWTLK